MIEEEMSMEELQETHQITIRGGARNVIWIHTPEDG